MVKQKNNIGVMVINYHGIVKSINEKVIELDNDKKTPYRLGTTEMKYPNGDVDEILTRFYVKSIEAHPDVFKVGEKIGLEIQAEGDYAGRTVAKLGGNNVDMAKLLAKVSTVKIEAKKADAIEVEE